MTDEQFYFSSEEAYLILVIYKNGCECKYLLIHSSHHLIFSLASNDLANFPHSLWGVVQSAENLTPRGLKDTFSSNEQSLEEHSLDSFLLSKRREESNGDE